MKASYLVSAYAQQSEAGSAYKPRVVNVPQLVGVSVCSHVELQRSKTSCANLHRPSNLLFLFQLCYLSCQSVHSILRLYEWISRCISCSIEALQDTSSLLVDELGQCGHLHSEIKEYVIFLDLCAYFDFLSFLSLQEGI